MERVAMGSCIKKVGGQLKESVLEVFDALDIGAAVIDSHYQVLQFNKKAEEIYGEYTPGEYCYQTQARQDRVCDDCPVKVVLSGSKRSRTERKITTASGREMYVECVASPIRDDHGRLAAVLVLSIDITERKLREEELQAQCHRLEKLATTHTRELDERERALKRSLLELEAIIDALPGMVSVVDQEFNTIVANDAVVEKFGNSNKDEVLYRKCYQVRKGRDDVCPQCAILQSFKTGEPVSRISTPEEEALLGIATKSYAIPLKDEIGAIWGGVEVIMDINDLRQKEKSLRENEMRLVQEIIQRKEIEKALRESEERLDLALSGANEGIWDWDLEKGTVHFDSRYYTLAGYEPNEFPSAFEEWEKRVHPDDIQPAQSAIKQYLEGKLGKFIIEFRFLRKNGDYMWIQGKGKVVARNENGRPRRFVGTHSDITERKKNEESLRMTQFSFDKAAVGIQWIDSEARLLAVNEKAAQMLGYTREELTSKTILDLDSLVNSRKDWDVIWQTLCEHSLDSFETIHRKKDGSEIQVEINSNLLEYEGRQYSIAFVHDITERKRTGEELRQLRNYLSNIIDSMPSVLVGVDTEGRVTQWNKQAEKATGLAFDEVCSKPLDTVFEQLKDQMGHIKSAIKHGRVIRNSKILRKEDMETRFENVIIFPLVANGVEGAVIRVDDVTEQVLLEEMMVQSEKMLSVGGLAAGMAHEINNPLAGMMQTANVMGERLTNPDLPANQKAAEAAGTNMEAITNYMKIREIPRMISTVHESGQRVAAIVENMLSFARKSEATFFIQFPRGTDRKNSGSGRHRL